MAVWAWMDYIDPSLENQISQWRAGLPNRARGKFDQRLDRLAGLPKEEWPILWAKPLQGVQGVFEIRFEVGNVQYRPLFCFGPENSQLSLLAGAVEQDDKLVPRGIAKKAESRKLEIEADHSRVTKHGLLEE